MIFASNTSTIPIARLAEGAKHPENVVGMHFFSPVHKMPLLEIIRHPGTSDEALATTVAIGREMGKTIIVVDDGPGFFTSRVLGTYMNEAAWLLTEGASIDQIDRALTRWGWPVGPITLFDEVGLDIARHAGETVREHAGERLAAPPALERMTEDDRTGRKGGRGFYLYEDGKKGDPDESVYALLGWSPAQISDQEIVERCVFQMVNETARCIEEGIIESPDDIDIGVIFGFGFPPFRGGLLKEVDRLGASYVVERLDHYAERHGERLRPADLLRRKAESGETFHS
jgi:3-hydroxyacyl-CoA dehydrogenase / enoyl-CoA hydratase / 3-hydroxybutyryl-CoA epimerase